MPCSDKSVLFGADEDLQKSESQGASPATYLTSSFLILGTRREGLNGLMTHAGDEQASQLPGSGVSFLWDDGSGGRLDTFIPTDRSVLRVAECQCHRRRHGFKDL